MKKSLFFLIMFAIVSLPVQAHANLKDSSPPANTSLQVAPQEIRLWFTEPVEPAFSRILLRDSTGALIETGEGTVDPDDEYQFVLPVPDLPDALYTVSWRVVSAADGHSSEGSFAFGINVTMTGVPTATGTQVDENVSFESVLIRAFHFLAMSLAVGSLGFLCFVWWRVPDAPTHIEKPLSRLVWVGWGLLGAASCLFLLLQTSTTADIPLTAALTHPALGNLLTQTMFGALWLVRMAIWIAWGVLLFASRNQTRLRWETLATGMGFLLAQSLFSHASATQDMAAILSDWLHLLATTLWVGGLVMFVWCLIVLRREKDESTTLIASLIALFSNYARVCVAVLIVTGLYAAWLQVGSIEALVNTRYGQALIIKLVLFAPLLGTAAINLLWTYQRINQGQTAWVGRLRGLIGAEIALTCGVLIAVGMMTAGSPARGIQALHDAAAAASPAPEPYFGMETNGDLMIHLDVMPGIVGENEFRISLADMDTGAAINDASLIRLRFDNLTQNLGQSELRPIFTDNGEYLISGANLSAIGEWRIRVNIQRPGQYDTVQDFTIKVDLPPTMPPVESEPPLSAWLVAHLLTGVALLGVGGFLGGWWQRPPLIGGRVIAGAALAVGAVFFLSAADTWSTQTSVWISDAYATPATQEMTSALYFTLTNQTPYSEELIRIETDIAGQADLHATRVEDDVASMDDVPVLQIPAFDSVTVGPSTMHIMLDDLTQPLEEGDTFDITLIFASGRRLTTAITIKNQ